VATLLTQIVYWMLNYHFSQKEYFIPFEKGKVLIIFLTGGLLSFAGLFLNEMHIVPRLIIKTGCVLGFPFLLYLFGFYEKVELQAIRGFFTKWSDLRNLGKNLRSLKGIQ
jgi:hypothetical protein